jgi:hypothetical protein
MSRFFGFLTLIAFICWSIFAVALPSMFAISLHGIWDKSGNHATLTMLGAFVLMGIYSVVKSLSLSLSWLKGSFHYGRGSVPARLIGPLSRCWSGCNVNIVWKVFLGKSSCAFSWLPMSLQLARSQDLRRPPDAEEGVLSARSHTHDPEPSPLLPWIRSFGLSMESTKAIDPVRWRREDM